MIESDDRYSRLIFFIVRRVPGRLVALIGGISYFGVGLALPLALGWSIPWLIAANVYGALFAASLGVGWLVAQIVARDRRHLLEWSSDLRLLDGEEFEWLVGEIFRREGWAVVERGRQDVADGNIDLELNRGSERRLVQCKKWTVQWVGVDEIRKFAGTLTREKLPPSQGTYVTFSRFNRHAESEARQLGIEMIDTADLMRRVESVRKPEPCATCGQSMVLDRSIHGWWYRCTRPGCGGKRDLGRDPGRAVALLTDQ